MDKHYVMASMQDAFEKKAVEARLTGVRCTDGVRTAVLANQWMAHSTIGTCPACASTDTNR